MQSGASLLDAHVVTLAQDLAVLRDETGADGHATFRSAFAGFVQCGLEAWVVHGHVSFWAGLQDCEYRNSRAGMLGWPVEVSKQG